MSEAMSSIEIEDVLSSIRRLVSEDHRPSVRPVEPKKHEDKLILTPAFRVVPDLAPAPLPRLHLGAEPEIEKLAATLERAVEAQDVEWESEVGDPAPLVAKMEWTEAGWAVVAEEIVATPPWAQADPGPPPTESRAPAFAIPPTESDIRWADQAEAAAVADLDDGQRAEVAYDEQVLRDLVRDILREELQGALGERITRNVRKLVRAEIARVLAAQDLD